MNELLHSQLEALVVYLLAYETLRRVVIAVWQWVMVEK